MPVVWAALTEFLESLEFIRILEFLAAGALHTVQAHYQTARRRPIKGEGLIIVTYN